MAETLTYWQARVRRLRRIIAEIEETGTSSASISSGGGSRSYTRLDLGMLNNLLEKATAEAAAEYNAAHGAPTIGGMGVLRPHFGRAW